jgi:hypothetical protein
MRIKIMPKRMNKVMEVKGRIRLDGMEMMKDGQARSRTVGGRMEKGRRVYLC